MKQYKCRHTCLRMRACKWSWLTIDTFKLESNYSWNKDYIKLKSRFLNSVYVTKYKSLSSDKPRLIHSLHCHSAVLLVTHNCSQCLHISKCKNKVMILLIKFLDHLLINFLSEKLRQSYVTTKWKAYNSICNQYYLLHKE